MDMTSDITIQAWISLLKSHQKALSIVEHSLKEAELPVLAWYDILLELEKSGKKGLRPFELEANLLLTQYGVSRVVERIKKSGYLTQEACENDRRGHRLYITKDGIKIRKKMWPVYWNAMNNALGAKLTLSQQKKLREILSLITD